MSEQEYRLQMIHAALEHYAAALESLQVDEDRTFADVIESDLKRTAADTREIAAKLYSTPFAMLKGNYKNQLIEAVKSYAYNLEESKKELKNLLGVLPPTRDTDAHLMFADSLLKDLNSP